MNSKIIRNLPEKQRADQIHLSFSTFYSKILLLLCLPQTIFAKKNEGIDRLSRKQCRPLGQFELIDRLHHRHHRRQRLRLVLSARRPLRVYRLRLGLGRLLFGRDRPSGAAPLPQPWPATPRPRPWPAPPRPRSLGLGLGRLRPGRPGPHLNLLRLGRGLCRPPASPRLALPQPPPWPAPLLRPHLGRPRDSWLHVSQPRLVLGRFLLGLGRRLLGLGVGRLHLVRSVATTTGALTFPGQGIDRAFDRYEEISTLLALFLIGSQNVTMLLVVVIYQPPR